MHGEVHVRSGDMDGLMATVVCMLCSCGESLAQQYLGCGQTRPKPGSALESESYLSVQRFVSLGSGCLSIQSSYNLCLLITTACCAANQKQQQDNSTKATLERLRERKDVRDGLSSHQLTAVTWLCPAAGHC